MALTVMQVLHQPGGSGSVTSTLHLALALARRGARVRFVCPPDSEVEAQARAGGLEVHPLRLRKRARRRNARALAELLRRDPVDLVNSQSARDREALAWLALTRRLPCPWVFTRRQMPRTLLLENWIVSRLAARVVAVSHPVAEELARRGTPRERLAVIPNGLVTERLDAPVSTLALQEWRERIGWDPLRRTVGILARVKDQQVVLGALRRVRTPVRLVLAGLDHMERIAPLARRVPSRHAVVLLRFHPDVRPLYELLEAALLPSRMEGLSQALLEAMALGKPVVASAAAGNLDLIRDGVDGLLVPPLDEDAWAAAIERVLGDSDLAQRLGEAARRRARVDFSLERTAERTEALYREVLEERRRG
jgi:glycosyltransferase involved in cell wall biosynthesis